jgi:hypothetical protein
VEREDARGRPSVEKAAGGVPFVSVFTARDVRTEHLSQMDDTEPVIFAVAATCEICGRPAVANVPRNRCEAHRA